MKEEKIVQKWKDPDEFIIEHLIVQKAVPIGDDGEVSVVEEYVESKRYNRQDYINSFRNDVGILNIIKKVGIDGAMNLMKWTGSSEVQDISNLPTNIDDAYNIVDNAHKTYASLPEDLKGKMSYEEFVKFFDQEAFDKYIASKQNTASKQNEGGDKDVK